jgi:DNA-binding NarL/FixJ family response regulator
MDIPVAIVEDNRDIRLALEEIITTADGYKLCGSCTSGEEALKSLPRMHAKVVLMDINLGGITGIEVVRQLKAEFDKDILFMMCTVYEEDEQIFEALNAGASGYILKKTAPHKMLEAIKELYEGGSPMSSQIARKVVAAFQNKMLVPAAPPPSNQSLEALSKREMEVLESLAKGLTYREIAEQHLISQETVRKHVYHIYEKLHVNNRVEAVNKFFHR